MTTLMRHTTVLGLLAIATFLAVPCAQAAAVQAPLPSSDYSVESVCSAPPPGHASCLALQLVPTTPEARAHTHPLGVTRASERSSAALTPAENGYGLRPKDLHTAYKLSTTTTGSQTIALVDAYNDPSAAEDLASYEHEFGLSCTGCFSKVNQNGETTNLPFPATARKLEEDPSSEASGWSVEISLDIETARAVCENCHILLVEADSTSYEDLEAAVRTAERLGATEISNSYGGSEEGETPVLERASAYKDPGVVITASAGDDGYLSWDSKYAYERGYAEFPASSPHVVAVGGTRLELTENGAEWAGESVWNGDGAGGGGCSVELAAPAWQLDLSDWKEVGCGENRSVADVSADADPYTGVAVHDTSVDCLTPEEEREARERAEGKTPIGSGESTHHWCTIGGTSLASPLIASSFALAGGAGGVEYPAQTLYERAIYTPGSLHYIATGSNGKCSRGYDVETGISNCSSGEEAAASCPTKLLSCEALAGYEYNGPTGVGSPDGIEAFEPLSSQAKDEVAEKIRARAKAQEEAEAAKAKAEARAEEERAEAKAREAAKTEANAEAEARARAEAKLREEAAAHASSQLASIAPSLTAIAPTSTAPAVRITALALTLKAILALDSGKPKLSQVGFAFTLSATARVNVKLERRIRTHGRLRWTLVRPASTISAAAGLNTRRLSGSAGLMPGLYRLTLTPAHATARSITFQIG